MQAFLKEQHVTYPVAIDPDGSVAERFNFRAVPAIVLIDRHGTIRFRGHHMPARQLIQQAL